MTRNITDRIKQIIEDSKQQKTEKQKRLREKEKRKEQKRRDFYTRMLESKNTVYEDTSLEQLDSLNLELVNEIVGNKNSTEQASIVKPTSSGIKLNKKIKTPENLQRIHKVIAATGLASVRKAEQLIAQGVVSVNGVRATIGQKVNVNEPGLKIRVNGEIINHQQVLKQPCRILFYNKQEGEICTRNDPEGRTTVFERLPRLSHGRWVQVGRLDINTSGLLLFTNDGELAHRLMHPSYQVERKYICRVYGEVTDNILATLKRGVELEDGFAKFKSINQLSEGENNKKSNNWFEVSIDEGRNQEVRRLWESQNLVVSRLIRTEYAGISLNRDLSIPPRGYLEADLREINAIRALVQLKPESIGEDPDYTKGWSKSEIKRAKGKYLKQIRGAIRKHKKHFGEVRTDFRDERTKERRDQRHQLVEKISQQNKAKFKKDKGISHLNRDSFYGRGWEGAKVSKKLKAQYIKGNKTYVL